MLSGYACCLAHWEPPKILCPHFRTRFLPPSVTQCQLLVITNCQCDTFPPLPPLHMFPVPMLHIPYIASCHDLVHSCFYPHSEATILYDLLPNKWEVCCMVWFLVAFFGTWWPRCSFTTEPFHLMCAREGPSTVPNGYAYSVPGRDLLQCYLAWPVFFPGLYNIVSCHPQLLPMPRFYYYLHFTNRKAICTF